MDKYHHGSLRPALLKAAAKLVGKMGAEGLTLREVARRAGVSHNAPYRHFKSREDLVAALAAESFDQLRQEVETAIEPAAAGKPKLEAAALAYLRFALHNPARFDVMFHSSLDGASYPDYATAYRACWGLLAQLMEHAQSMEDSESVADEAAADLVWSAVHGIATLGLAKRLRYGDAAELEKLAVAAVDRLASGRVQ